MTEDIVDQQRKEYIVVETKRHKPCLLFRGYRYVQDKVQNRTVYWRCEDRARCNGRAHQLVGNGSLPILTIKHNHQALVDELGTDETRTVEGRSRHRKRQHLQMSFYQSRKEDDLLLSPASSTMTSPIKLENHSNRQQQFAPHQHGAMVKNLHLSEVITTTAATNTHHYNGMDTHRQHAVDPIEMTKLLSNITTATSSSSKTMPESSTIDYSSRLNHFSWEEIEGRYVPVIFRNENDCLQRYTSKMFVENTLFQSESWQRHAILARSLPPLISFPYTDNELKLFRSIVEWHLASFHFKTILPSDCLIRFDDLLDFYGALRKLRDTVSATSFGRPLPPPPIPALIPMGPPKQRHSSSSAGPAQAFELPTMVGSTASKPSLHHRHSSATKVYPPSVHHPQSPNYLLQQNVDLLASLANSSSQAFNYSAATFKPTVPILPSPSSPWSEGSSKINDKIRSSLPRHVIPHNTSLPQEQILRDKRFLTQKLSQQINDNSNILSRETKESGWVQINNVFVPYIVKVKLRESELEKCPTRQPAPQLQREFYVPYEILIKCHIFADNEFAFKKFLIKATQQDFDIFNSLISNINIFDEKVPEKTLLVNLYHVMIGLPKILYVKLLTSKQPRTQVNKYHAEVLTHKGGTLLMHGNKLVPYIIQNNRFYVPLVYAYHSLPHILAQAKRGARAPRQYEIEYLNLLFLFFSIDSPPLTSDTLLVDAFSIKSADLQPPIHFRTLSEHQQHERNRLLNTIMRLTQSNSKLPGKSQQLATKVSAVPNPSTQKTLKCPPANVVVNPLIHHPSFYGLPSSTSPIKQTPLQPAPSSSHSVALHPLLLPAEFATKRPAKPSQIKTIKYDHHSLTAIAKSPESATSEWKVSIRHIFDKFSFDINYEKFIQWCQTNLLLPLIKLDDEERKMANDNDETYYVYHRHLERCMALLNDLKRGTISMTLLPPSNNEPQPQEHQTGPSKSPLAGAKKRKTTVPTTRHIPPPSQASPVPALHESQSVSETNGHLSPELPLNKESNPVASSPITMATTDNTTVDEDVDDLMPVVAIVEEEPVAQEANPSDVNSSFLIVESSDGDDGKVHLDYTLPSCSSGYESAAPLTNVDVNMAHQVSSDEDDNVDDDETNSATRSREHSSSCHSEQSLTPILSTVSSNIKLILNAEEKTPVSPVTSYQKTSLRERDKQGKFRVRSRSPTPRHVKKKRSSNEHISSGNTITSDQIEHHLRTLLPVVHEQRRTRTRPIKTPTRLVEEIASSHHTVKSTEPDLHVFDTLPTSPPMVTTDAIDTPFSSEPAATHPTCTYNVTICTKPNKLGLTIKKVIQR